jgi:hypothetical protein
MGYLFLQELEQGSAEVVANWESSVLWVLNYVGIQTLWQTSLDFEPNKPSLTRIHVGFHKN